MSVQTVRMAAEKAEAEARREARDAALKRIGAPAAGLYSHHDPWTCPACGETTTPPDTATGPFPPRSVVECACITAAEDEAVAAVRAEFAPHFRAAHIREAGVPARYRGCTFESFENRPGVGAMLEACRSYADTFDPRETTTGLFLVGPVGTGKTHLATAAAIAIADRTEAPFLWIGAGHYLATLRSSYDRPGGTDLPERAERAELLVLDDLAQERVTEWTRDILYTLIDARYMAARPTIITSNVGDRQLRNLYGAALVSRLYEMAKAVKVNASDYREELAA